MAKTSKSKAPSVKPPPYEELSSLQEIFKKAEEQIQLLQKKIEENELRARKEKTLKKMPAYIFVLFIIILAIFIYKGTTEIEQENPLLANSISQDSIPDEPDVYEPTVYKPTLHEPTLYKGNLTPEPKIENKTSNAVNYGDDDKGNGYYYQINDLWIPGIPTYRSQFLFMPLIVKGTVLPYAPNMMEGTANYKRLSIEEPFIDGVALPFCSMIGSSVWIKRPYDMNAEGSGEWEGPFQAVDCAGIQDLYNVVVHRNEVLEIGYETAKDWGMAKLEDPDDPYSWYWDISRIDNVIVSLIPPECLPPDFEPVNLKEWFLEKVDFYKTYYDFELDYKPLYRCKNREPEWKLSLEGKYSRYKLNIFYDYCDDYFQYNMLNE